MHLAVRVHAQDDLAPNGRIRAGNDVLAGVDGTGLLGRSEP